MTGQDVIFLVFAVVTIGAAGVVVFAKKITYAAFALMLSLFSVGGLYVFLSSDFLAAVQLIIYVGGILVLLLFGVLLTVKLTTVRATTRTGQRIWGSITAAGLLVLLLTLIYRGSWNLLSEQQMEYAPQSQEIGERLMTSYLLPFEVASVLLLLALIGAMFLIRSESKSEHK